MKKLKHGEASLPHRAKSRLREAAGGESQADGTPPVSPTCDYIFSSGFLQYT